MYYPIIPLLLTLTIQYTSADVTPRHPLSTYYCSPNSSTTTTSSAATNTTTIKTLLSALSSATNTSLFHTASSGPAYALYLCRGDATLTTCKKCVAAASSNLLTACPRGMGAAIWYDACMIRYSNEPFLGHVDDGALFNATELTDNGSNTSSFSADYQRRMNSLVATTAGKAATEAAFGGGGMKFATKVGYYKDVLNVSVVAQCTPDLTDKDCYDCLVKCTGKLPTCCSTEGARALFLSCNLGYEVRKLYSALAPAPAFGVSETKRRAPIRQTLKLVAVAAGVLIFLMLLSSLWLCIYKKKTKEVYEEDVIDIIEVESLHLEFNVIRAATQNFAIDRKLGQGGFGQVYKGTLENGQDIAVKRLSVNSGQGVAEFKTEVVLVAKLQHRNLVKLLGFCISGKEKILVYEFLPNSSLDKILFDATKRMSLNWETRFKIISGIAKGLLYLHEDSRLKIVHRDLKLSNILLDEAMNPKISDFGLAKLFGVDQTQDATSKIAGTYGYMAPEYIFTGRYSVKSDVYSFGIMVLEVVSGQRNYMSRPRDDEALLQQAWRHWNESKTLNLVDEALGDDFSREEVNKCIHIGLLCIQENDARRPNMATVVAALGGQAIALPSPLPPSFCNATDSTSIENASVCKTSDITELFPR